MLSDGRKVVAIIPTRMGSTRLPRKNAKHLKWKGSNFNTQDHIAMRLNKVQRIDRQIFAFPNTEEDTDFVNNRYGQIWDGCKSTFIKDYAESKIIKGMAEGNVIERVLAVAIEENADVIVEVTSDCPFIDPLQIQEMLDIFYDEKLDYISNVFPFVGERTLPDGFDVQIYSKEILILAYKIAKASVNINKNSQDIIVPHCGYNILVYKAEIEKQLHRVLEVYYKEFCEENFYDKGWSVTLDTKEDLELLRNICYYFKDSEEIFGWQEIRDLLTKHPELLKINSHIKRKDPNKES